MKKIIFSICLTTLFQISLFGCSFTWIPFCDHIDAYDNILAGVITAKSDKGISIDLLEVFKGPENSTSITVWDGIAGDCNGTPEISDTRYYGNVGDTIIFALGTPITKVTYDWDVVGDYRKPVNFYNYTDVWNPEFFKVENNQIVIEQAYDEPLIYSYAELTAHLSSGDCISNINEHGNCNETDDPLNLPWFQNLINGVNFGYGSLQCDCNESIAQYCYNNDVYFSTRPLQTYCADNQSYIFDADGNVVCVLDGIAGGGPCSLPERFGQEAEFVKVVWSCNENCGCAETVLEPVCGVDGKFYKNKCFAQCAGTKVEKVGACDESLCTNFAFANASVICDANCKDFFEFELNGGDGNYTVANYGTIVESGDPVENIWEANNTAQLIAIDGNGCQTEVNVPVAPCSVEPELIAIAEANCIGNGLFTVGVRIIGDQYTYQVGADQFGQSVSGSHLDEVYITLVSNEFNNRIEIVNLENGCITNAFIRLENPNCDNPINNCDFEDPLTDLPWLNELIENAQMCTVGIVEQFSYEGEEYIKINPYYQYSYNECPTDLPIKVYNCEGDLVCTIGGYGLQLKHSTNKTYFDECDSTLTNAALNATLLWTYSEACENPLELEVVQNAISNFCTDALYAFEYNNQSYVYIVDNVRCDGIEQYGQLYNCSIGTICTLGSCEPVFNQIQNQLNEENLIWVKEIDPYEKYPWLSDLINPEYCAVKVTEYNYSDYYTFVLLDNGDETGRLYFQDGTLYCNNETNYCLSLYNLAEPGNLFFDCTTGNEHLEVNVSNLTCTNNGQFTIEVTVTDDLGTPTNGQYGIYHAYGEGLPQFIHFSEGETISFEGTVADAANGLYNVYVYDRNLADDAAQTIEIDVTECLSEETIFNQYNWLYSLVDPNNCSGVKITEHFYGSYTFLYVEDNNSGTLYFQDGTFYCADNLDSYCLALYGFDIPTTTWHCEDGNEEGCRIDDPLSLSWVQDIITTSEENYTDAIIYFEYEGNSYLRVTGGNNLIDGISIATYICDGTLLCVSSIWFEEIYVEGSEEVCRASVMNGETIWVRTSSNVLFETYPWLNTLVDPTNCSGTSIEVYAYGTYEFISVEDNEGKKLYFQDGTFYCTDRTNYSCTDLYGLNEIKNQWNCDGGSSQKKASIQATQKIDFKVDFKIFPNPSNGQFTIIPEDIHTNGSINILDISGKTIKTLQAKTGQKQITVDLTGFPKGVYFIRLQSDNNTSFASKKVIIQ